MPLIKNDVTDQDIENLFDHQINTKFKDENSENNESNNEEDSIVPKELDVKSGAVNKITRPDEYKPDQVHKDKLNVRKELERLNTESTDEELLQTSGPVDKKVFSEIVRAKKQAQLEEFKAKQRKLPVIQPTARYPLWGDQPKCTFHVYKPYQPMSFGRMLCACKFCSQVKVFSETEWRKYEIENRKYM